MKSRGVSLLLLSHTPDPAHSKIRVFRFMILPSAPHTQTAARTPPPLPVRAKVKRRKQKYATVKHQRALEVASRKASLSAGVSRVSQQAPPSVDRLLSALVRPDSRKPYSSQRRESARASIPVVTTAYPEEPLMHRRSIGPAVRCGPPCRFAGAPRDPRRRSPASLWPYRYRHQTGIRL